MPVFEEEIDLDSLTSDDVLSNGGSLMKMEDCVCLLQMVEGESALEENTKMRILCFQIKLVGVTWIGICSLSVVENSKRLFFVFGDPRLFRKLNITVLRLLCDYSEGDWEPNGALIVYHLIPKTQEAKMMKDFRPITLIGSLYKIIAKILANHLVVVLEDLVSDVQSAFVAKRQILDGPFILKELFQWCKMKKKHTMIFKSLTCVNFLWWFDPPMCHESVQIISGLLRSRKELEEILAMVEEKRLKLMKFIIISWVVLGYGIVDECGFELIDGMNNFGYERRSFIQELERLPRNLEAYKTREEQDDLIKAMEMRKVVLQFCLQIHKEVDFFKTL
ncbi:hypothetical protein Tco_0237770 [Tanacetum coccineum]